MRRATFGAAGGGAASATTIDVTLDRLTISEGLALTGFRGNFGTRGGFNGSFDASVNGAAPVHGTVAPTKIGRSAFRITSDNAGKVLAASHIFERARSGTLDLRLTPFGGPGSYDGLATIKDLKVKDAPVLAAMLGAVSGIGLLEQLSGDGLGFSTMSRGPFA